MQSPVRLSIIIPVYNNPTLVRAAVDIAAAQTCKDGAIEVIVVDDGSTDETPSVLAELAVRHENLRVIRQDNSGWAGGPRNTGLAAARGDYVFFHDADDRLDGDCLGAAVAYADDKGSDVVLVKIEGRGGRRTHADVFEETQELGDIRKLVRSNFCFKLFRRSFLKTHDLAFPPHKIRLEDAQFCFRAYSLAEKVSILADRTYYYVYSHGGGGTHISRSVTAPHDHADGIRASLTPLLAGPWDESLRREALADYFRRVVLNRFSTSFSGRPMDVRQGWIGESIRLVREFGMPEKLYEFYSPLNRARMWSLAVGNSGFVETISKQGSNSRIVLTEVDRVRLKGLQIEIQGTASALLGADELERLRIHLSKGKEVIAEIDAALQGTPELQRDVDAISNACRRFRATIPARRLISQGVVKVHASAVDSLKESSKSLRVGLVDGAHLRSRLLGITIEAFPTALGGLNLRLASGAKALLTKLTGRDRRRGTRGVDVAGAEAAPLVGRPQHRVYDLTWSIPFEYGGLTKAMLERSRSFVTHLGTDVDLLTLDYKFDVDEARARLRTSGEMIDGMRLRNLWEELSGFDRTALNALGGQRPVPRVGEPSDPERARRSSRFVEYLDNGGEIERVDHLRPDGSVFAIDDRSGTRRRVVLVDPRGGRVAQFTRVRDLYFAWLDAAIGADPAVLINESKAIGAYLWEYRRDHIQVGQVLHNTHIDHRTNSTSGPFTKSRLGLLAHWYEFDFVVFLTEKQKLDFIEAFGDSPTLTVIPNSTPGSDVESAAIAERVRNRGVVVARLTNQKRVDRALDAVRGVTESISLDIIGDGDKRNQLEKRRDDDALLKERVTFEGHVDGAAARLSGYSFILLTSAFEGMGIVLIEAMARGCIPIAFDIRYGPSDIIDHGENGFLVDDARGASDAISALLNMSEDEVHSLRRAAMEKARAFSEEAVTSRWSSLFSGLRGRAPMRTVEHAVCTASEAVALHDGDIRVTLENPAEYAGATLVLRARDRYYSFASDIDSRGVASFTRAQLSVLPSGAMLDAWCHRLHGERLARLRVRWSGSDAVKPSNLRVAPQRTDKGELSFAVA